VGLEIVGLGTRCVRIGNLPLEILESIVRAAFSQYGEVQSIQDETWSKTYQYAVTNGSKAFTVAVKKHNLSHITIADYRVLTSYEGKPQICYG
jgi:RNA recognition motif-containing protein